MRTPKKLTPKKLTPKKLTPKMLMAKAPNIEGADACEPLPEGFCDIYESMSCTGRCMTTAGDQCGGGGGVLLVTGKSTASSDDGTL